MEKQTIEFRTNEPMSTQVKELYKETLDEKCETCDLIIKTGVQRFEHKCHRIILGSASKLLWNMLASAPEEKLPVLIIPDATSAAVKYLLDYVYNGQVRVPMRFYADFIDACQLLEIKTSEDAVELMMDVETNDEMLESSEKDMKHEKELMINGEDDDDRSASEIEDVSFGDYSKNDAENDENASKDKVSYNLRKRNTESQLTKILSESESDFDSDTDFSSSDDFSDDEDTFELNKEKNVKENSITTFSKHDKEIRAALKSIRLVYETMIKKPQKSIDEVMNSVKLIYKEEKLVKATSVCGFCDKLLSLMFDSNNYWKNGKMKNHLTKMHKIKFSFTKTNRTKDEMAKLTQITKAYHERQVKQHIRAIYERLNKKPDDDLESVVNKTKLVMNENFLVRAEHPCGFCGITFNSTYWKHQRGKIYWYSKILRNHLRVAHKLKFTSSGNVKNTKSAVEIKSKAMKIDCEKRVKRTVKLAYERLNLKPDGDFEEIVNKTTLVIENGKLMRAQHTCGFCHKLISFAYTNLPTSKRIDWNNGNLKIHLLRKHT